VIQRLRASEVEQRVGYSRYGKTYGDQRHRASEVRQLVGKAECIRLESTPTGIKRSGNMLERSYRLDGFFGGPNPAPAGIRVKRQPAR